MPKAEWAAHSKYSEDVKSMNRRQNSSHNFFPRPHNALELDSWKQPYFTSFFITMFQTHFFYTEDSSSPCLPSCYILPLGLWGKWHSCSLIGGNNLCLQDVYPFALRVLQKFFPKQVKFRSMFLLIKHGNVSVIPERSLLSLVIKVSVVLTNPPTEKSFVLCNLVITKLVTAWSCWAIEVRAPFPLTSYQISLRPVILSLIPGEAVGREKSLTYFLNSFYKI